MALPVVVIASIRGWRASLPAIELIAPQVAKVGAEIVVADGSGAAAPTEAELAGMGCQVHWLPLPGKSVFQLRRAAYRASRGDVGGNNRDHCFVAAKLESKWFSRPAYALPRCRGDRRRNNSSTNKARRLGRLLPSLRIVRRRRW